jgi:hypothetical protein
MVALDYGKHIVRVASLLLCTCLTSRSLADDSGPWHLVEVGTRGDLSVRLKVRPRVSLADKDWMIIEFENRGDSDIELLNTSYRIESKRSDLKTGDPRSSGGLASGNEYDLFPHAWKTPCVAPRVVKPGIYRVIDHPSMYSSALLGLPPRDGWLVNATLSMRVEIKGDGVLSDSQDAHAFQFEWLYPDEAGFQRARARLKSLLTNPENMVQHAYLLHCLLSVPKISRVVGVPELLASLKNRDDPFAGREYVLEHLGNQYARDKIVVEHFRKRLEAGDVTATGDLRRAVHVWDPSYLDPLVTIFANDQRSWDNVLLTLERNGMPQKKDKQLASRLSAEMLKRYVIGKLPPGALRRHNSLRRSLPMLARSRDRTLIPKIAPHLDDSTRILDPRFLATAGFGSLPPLRVCDAALEAIMTLLDEDVHVVYRQRVKPDGKGLDALETAFNTARDQMIDDLKARLKREF